LIVYCNDAIGENIMRNFIPDQDGANSYYEDWNHSLHEVDIASNGQRVTTALGLRIAADVLRSFDGHLPMPYAWTAKDLKLARAAIAGVRAQGGVTGPDAECLRGPDGMLFATEQVDIWIYG
jgi:hypothetical protein